MGNAKPSLRIDPPKSKVAFKSGPALLRGVLGKTLRRYGLDKEIARYQFVLHWQEIVGQQLAQMTEPRSVRSGVLEVGVSSSVLAQELSFQKSTILARLRRYLSPEQTISDIRFYVAGRSEDPRR